MKLTYINENNLSIVLTYSYPFFLQSIEGEDGLENKIISNSSAYEDGTAVVSTKINERYINLTGVIKGLTTDDVLNKRKELIKVFNPKLKGTLIYENGDIKKSIECYIEDAPRFSNRNIRTQKNFIIRLYCHNPYWTDIKQSKAEIALWKGQFHFPLIIPKNEGIIVGLKQPRLIVNILNDGDVKTGMVIEFKARGTLTNPSLFNVNTREYIKINKSMVVGEIIRVNTNFNKKRIESILNGVTTNILNYIDLGGGDTFLQLDVSDNLFRYDADTNPSNLEINIYYSQKYLGV